MAPIVSEPSALTWLSIVTVLVCLVCNFFVVHPVTLRLRVDYKARPIRIPLVLNYATAAFPCAILLLAIGALRPAQFLAAIVGTSDKLQPWAVLVLFFAMAYICISLDLTGILEYVSLKVFQHAGDSGRRLLLLVFLLSSVMTIFSSNDVVIMTLTPIILYMSQHINCNALSFLFAQFHAANLLGMIWFMGNTTNVLLSLAFEIPALPFTEAMALPTLLIHMLTFAIAAYYFRNDIPMRIERLDVDPRRVIRDARGGLFIGFIVVTCIVILFVASLTNWPIWVITLAAAGLAFGHDLAADLVSPHRALIPTEIVHAIEDSTHQLPHRFPPSTMSASDNLASKGCADEPDMTPTFALSSGDDSIGPTLGVLSRVATPNPVYDLDIHAHLEHRRISGTVSAPNISVEGQEHETPSQRQSSKSLEPIKIGVSTFVPMVLRRTLVRFSRRFPQVSECFARMPYSVLPFLIGQFAIVEALDGTGVLDYIGIGLAAVCSIHPIVTALLMMIIGCVLGCLMSNLPMTILLTKTLMSSAFNSRVTAIVHRRAAVLAIVAASNACTCLALPGCLAGLMWAEMLAAKGVQMPQSLFSKVGLVLLTVPILLGSVAIGGMSMWLYGGATSPTES